MHTLDILKINDEMGECKESYEKCQLLMKKKSCFNCLVCLDSLHRHLVDLI